MIIVAIDPGAHGAIAIVEDGVIRAVHDMPTFPLHNFTTKSDTIDVEAIRRIVGAELQRGHVEVVLENPQMRSSGEAVQTIAVAWHRHGVLMGALLSLGIQPHLVHAQVWVGWMRGVAHLGSRNQPSGAQGKEEVAKGVLRLFPAAKAWIYGPRGGLLDGRSDAIGIASYHAHISGEFQRLKALKDLKKSGVTF